MKPKHFFFIFLILALAVSISPVVAKKPTSMPSKTLLASGLAGAQGSTVGPDGALYVTEGATGTITRVDPKTGAKTTFASGLPAAVLPIGGAVDIVFIDKTAYVLVTMVGSDLPVPGGNSVVGIYRVDGPNSFTVVADIGEFSINNPSQSDVFIPSGVHYAMEHFQGSLIVTDGHHNRVLKVTLDGVVSELIAFGNIVPTGLEVKGSTVFMAEAGPNPHLPEVGKVVAFSGKSPSNVMEVASGAPLLVDVEFMSSKKLFALAQGVFPVGSPDGSPAMPNTGSLVMVNNTGSFTTIIDGLNVPTSLEFIGNTAYVVTLTGEIWMITGVTGTP